MLATRFGVRLSPSRSGSSPIAIRISRTARSIRSLSTEARWRGTAWRGLVSLTSSRSIGGVREDTRGTPKRFSPRQLRQWTGVFRDVRKIPVPLGNVEAVTNDEARRDAETDVTKIEVDFLQSLFHEERTDLERRRPTGFEVLAQVLQRETRIDDVLDDEDMTVRQVEIEVLENAHHTARARRGAVRRHGHEVELDRQIDGEGEVAHEHERALEHADEQRRVPRVVGRDALAELADALLQLGR